MQLLKKLKNNNRGADIALIGTTLGLLAAEYLTNPQALSSKL